ncbi:MAG: glycoside hydrolase family 130 protein [Vulcanimicrobiaceae bacterium]
MLTRRAMLGVLAGGGALLSGALPATSAIAGPFGRWTRLSESPVLSPEGAGFQSAGVFNPSAVKVDDGVVLIYRAQDTKGTSRLGYAKSTDGIHFKQRAAPVLSPSAPYEFQGGVEDPRIVRIDGTYYMTYTGYNSVAETAQLCLATSTDLLAWERHGVILPANVGTWNVHWTKSGAIVPQKVNGRWWMYYLGESDELPAGQMGIAVSDDLLVWKDATRKPIMHTRPRMFDSAVCEPGPAPIVTDDGILLIYNGANDYLVYSTGWALFDKTDPTKLIARSETPMFGAEKSWERIGQVPNVVFVEGLVRDGDRLTCYYGAADTHIGAVVTTLRPRSPAR